MFIRGQIWDAFTGLPIGGAVVTCVGPSSVIERHADDQGHFFVAVMQRGLWQLYVSKSPYTEKSVSLKVDRSVECNITLELEGLPEQRPTA